MVLSYLKAKYFGAIDGQRFIRISRQAAALAIEFNGSSLEEAAAITGPWTTVTGTSPLSVTPSQEQHFYRLKP